MPPRRAVHTRVKSSAGPATGPAHLRAELARKSQQLKESILALDAYAFQYDRFFDGQFGFLGGYGSLGGVGAMNWGWPADRTQDRSHAPLPYENEATWRLQVALYRGLIQSNHLAISVRDFVADFIGTVSVSFVRRDATDPGPSASQADPEVKAATAAWQEWCAFAEWGEGEEDTQRECLQRYIGEGETTVRFFVGDDDTGGLPPVRVVDPEFIRTPPGAGLLDPWGWGVKSPERDDAGPEEGLWITRSANANDGSAVPRAHYARAKNNVDRVIKRGLSDFFPCMGLLTKILELRESLAHNGNVLAKILWWEQFATATQDQVNNMLVAGQSYPAFKPPFGPGGSAQQTSVNDYSPGTVVRTEQGRQVIPPPAAVNTQNLLAIDAALMRGITLRFGLPAYFTGENDQSFAGTLVAGSPFVKRMGFRQERWKALNCKVAERFLQFCERSGRLPQGISKRIRPVAEAEQIVIADEEKQSRTFLAEYQAGVASPQAYIRSKKQDPEQVAADIKAWKAQNPPQQGPGNPPPAGGAPAGPKDPTPAPPASAGGDGSSPNNPDDLPVAEEFTGFDTDGALWLDGDRCTVWVAESAYALLSEAGKVGLTAKVVTNKNGVQQTVYVKTGTATGADQHQSGAKHEPEHVATRAVRDPASLTHADAAEFAKHLAAMPKEECRQLALAMRQKVGGTRAAIAERLLAHVRSKQGSSQPGAALAAPPTLPKNIDFGKEQSEGWGEGLQRRATQVLGTDWLSEKGGAELLAAASNAHDNSKVELVNFPHSLGVHTEGIGYQTDREFKRDASGKLYCRNASFEIEKNADGTPRNPNTPRGADLLANQVRALRRLGFDRIETEASGSAGEAALQNGYVGYKVWPKLGYDGQISEHHMASLPPELKKQMGDSNSILKLYETQAGQDWWAANGSAIHLTFDLKDGSRSMQTLQNYLANRKPKT